MRHSTIARACALTLTLGLSSAAWAQQQPGYDQPYQQPDPPPPPPPEGPDATAPPQDGTTTDTPPADGAVAQDQPGMENGPDTQGPPRPEALLDGHLRTGPFMAGPGSFTFVAHNTLLGAIGGFGTQFISSRGDLQKGKEGMLVGTLVGAGLGFGISTWWQFTHWMDRPVAVFTVINGLYAGMLAGGLVDSLSTDITALAYASFVSAELGGWLTAAIGGGEMRLADGLAIASAGGWSGAWTGLVLATLMFSGGTPPTSKTWVDSLLIAPGIGAAALACALLQIHPTANQVVRGDLFGLGVGVVVLATAGLVVGFQTSTPYILTLLSSAGALAAVSIFWEESAERPPLEALFGGHRLASKKPYNNPWW